LVKAGFVTQRGKFGVVQRGGYGDDIIYVGDTYEYISITPTGDVKVYKTDDGTKVILIVPDDFIAKKIKTNDFIAKKIKTNKFITNYNTGKINKFTIMRASDQTVVYEKKKQTVEGF